MFTRAAATFDPADLLREAEMLKDMAKGHHRPYIDVGRPLEQNDLEGLVNFPQLLQPEGQIVKDWGHFVNFDDGNVGFVATPPTLVAGRGRLHLVDAIATDVAEAMQWTGYEHITAETFEWTGGQLLADGVPCMERAGRIPPPQRHVADGVVREGPGLPRVGGRAGRADPRVPRRDRAEDGHPDDAGLIQPRMNADERRSSGSLASAFICVHRGEAAQPVDWRASIAAWPNKTATRRSNPLVTRRCAVLTPQTPRSGGYAAPGDEPLAIAGDPDARRAVPLRPRAGEAAADAGGERDRGVHRSATRRAITSGPA